MRRSEAHAVVAALREREGDTVVFGSQTLWTDLLSHGLVEELFLTIGPKVVAGDRPAFTGTPPVDLHLVGTRDYLDVGTIVLHYETAQQT